LAPQPGLKFGLQAMVGFEITNTGKLRVQIAIVPAWPTIQLEDAAVQMQMNWQNVSGLVQSLDDRKCWLEPFSVRDVPVGVVR
jgi:hypothetical protein